MYDMARGSAEWRNEMTEAEQRELELAERAKAASVEQYKSVFFRLKSRCVGRLRTKAKNDEA
jgi:hypothetical protein